MGERALRTAERAESETDGGGGCDGEQERDRGGEPCQSLAWGRCRSCRWLLLARAAWYCPVLSTE